MRETNFTLGLISKCQYLDWFCYISPKQAQNKPKYDICGGLGPIHYITLKVFAMNIGDGTKFETCFVD